MLDSGVLSLAGRPNAGAALVPGASPSWALLVWALLCLHRCGFHPLPEKIRVGNAGQCLISGAPAAPYGARWVCAPFMWKRKRWAGCWNPRTKRACSVVLARAALQ